MFSFSTRIFFLDNKKNSLNQQKHLAFRRKPLGTGLREFLRWWSASFHASALDDCELKPANGRETKTSLTSFEYIHLWFQQIMMRKNHKSQQKVKHQILWTLLRKNLQKKRIGSSILLLQISEVSGPTSGMWRCKSRPYSFPPPPPPPPPHHHHHHHECPNLALCLCSIFLRVAFEAHAFGSKDHDTAVGAFPICTAAKDLTQETALCQNPQSYRDSKKSVEMLTCYGLHNQKHFKHFNIFQYICFNIFHHINFN